MLGFLVKVSPPISMSMLKSAPTSNGGSMENSLMPPCFSISSRSGPFFREERISLLSPR